MTPIEAAFEGEKNPKVISNLQKALGSIGEADNKTVKLINCGGQGLIFKFISQRYSCQLLIKIPFYSRFSSEQIAEHAILKEARILEAITLSGLDISPRLISFDEAGLYLIREYAPGEELTIVLERSTEAERNQLLIKEYDFVRKLFPAFHDNDYEPYTIRDFKPKNIICASDKRLYIIDFGSCRPETQMVSANHNKVKNHIGNGKYLHWPIEQLFEEESVLDRRVDYFAWGVMAYYTLFLERPYANDTCDLDKAKEEYGKRYLAACERIKDAYQKGRISAELKDNIIGSLNPNPRMRFFKTGL